MAANFVMVALSLVILQCPFPIGSSLSYLTEEMKMPPSCQFHFKLSHLDIALAVIR